MGNVVKLGMTNRWREMAAMTTILALAATVIALVALPGNDHGEAPDELKPATPVAATRQPDSVFAAATPAASDLPSGIDILEPQLITAVSNGAGADAEPALFRGSSTQEMPQALCVHWKVFRHNPVTNGAEVIAEFFESCDENVTTTSESVPERFVRLENAALREQLSYIVSQLTWDEYLTSSERYSQARIARSLEVLTEHSGTP